MLWALVPLSLLILAVLAMMLAYTKQLYDILDASGNTSGKNSPQFPSGLIYIPVALVVLGLGTGLVIVYDWQAHALMWLNLLVRWAHVIIGIAWIGASFYFVFLENSLNRTKGLRTGLAGNLWAIHGGGFYYVEKYKVAPEQLPEKLHWFKYEAYFTWITGFLLLNIVYYADARLYMIDPEVMDMSPAMAVSIGIGSLVVAWLLYDVLCKSPLSKYPYVFTAIGFVLVCLSTLLLTHLFSGRAAYIHVGAMLGTCMAGNVFFVIIPSQKALVKAAENGEPLDPRLGQNAGWRSLHNNYMTLPVIFIMISNHYPATFGHQHNWLILAGLVLTSALLRHYLNLMDKGITANWILPLVVLGAATLAYATAPPSADEASDAEPVAFEEVFGIVQQRCNSCHAAKPTDDVWKQAPNGVMFDRPSQIAGMAAKIMQRVVVSKNMPLGNKTGITEEEREKIKNWILQGAQTQ